MSRQNKIIINNMMKINNFYKKSFSLDDLHEISNANWLLLLCEHLFFKNELIKQDHINYIMKIQSGSPKQEDRIFLFNIEIKNVNLVANADTALTDMFNEFNRFYISLDENNNVELSSDNIIEMYDSFKSIEEQKILNDSIKIAEQYKNNPRI